MWFSGMCRTFKNSHGTQETTWTTLYNLGEDELQNCHFGVPGLFAVTHLVLPIFVWFEEKHYTSWGRRQEIPFKLSIVCNSPPLIQHIWTFFWFSNPWRGWRSTAMPRCFFFPGGKPSNRCNPITRSYNKHPTKCGNFPLNYGFV